MRYLSNDKNKQLIFWLKVAVFNALVIYVSWMFYPQHVVLGNANMSMWASLVVVSLLLTLILSQVPKLLQVLKVKMKNEMMMGVYYGIGNIFGLWLIGRGAVYTGLGISSAIVAVVLGLILNLGQFLIWKFLFAEKK